MVAAVLGPTIRYSLLTIRLPDRNHQMLPRGARPHDIGLLRVGIFALPWIGLGGVAGIEDHQMRSGVDPLGAGLGPLGMGIGVAGIGTAPQHVGETDDTG